MGENINKWVLDTMWDYLHDRSEKSNSKILKNLLDWLAKLCKWELDETKTETQKNFSEIVNDLVTNEYNLTDKKISDEEEKILGKVLEAINQLDNNDKSVENWFKRLDEIEDKEFVRKEKEEFLSKLKKEADDEWDDEWEKKEADLSETEFNDILEFVAKKYDLCESVLKSEDEKFKALPDNLRTKKEIVDSCNKVLGHKNWDLNNIKDNFEDIKSKIIKDLEIKNKKPE